MIKDHHVLGKLFATGTSSSDVISEFERVRNHHVTGALKALSEFPNNDATIALRNIAGALRS